MQKKKIYLSNADKKIAGVCGGIGETFDIDSTLIRLVWILITVVTGIVPGVLGYIVSWVVIPKKQ
ncbi:PspC domain-containing protein [Patescibacteria group bacterium]|nr:PspC domain-containing protein [Patescibacteria group bacterium]MBU4115998.1 PspC domain-containing protein [Patescibacteria group bacterium]